MSRKVHRRVKSDPVDVCICKRCARVAFPKITSGIDCASVYTTHAQARKNFAPPRHACIVCTFATSRSGTSVRNSVPASYAGKNACFCYSITRHACIFHVASCFKHRRGARGMTVATTDLSLSPSSFLSLSPFPATFHPRTPRIRVPDWIFKRFVPENEWLDHRF